MNKFYLRFLKLRVLWRKLKENPYFVDACGLFICINSSIDEENWFVHLCIRWCIYCFGFIGIFSGLYKASGESFFFYMKKKHSIILITTSLLLLPIIVMEYKYGIDALFALVGTFFLFYLVTYVSLKFIVLKDV